MSRKIAKKVALYTPNLHGGGAQRVIVNLANAFSDLTIETDLVVANYSGPYRRNIGTNVNVKKLNSTRAFTSLPGLIEYLRRVEPSVLVSTLMYANVLAAAAHFLSGSKSKLVLRETNSISGSYTQDITFKDRLVFSAAYGAYRCADRVIALVESLSSEIQQVFGLSENKVQTIHNPVDLNRISKLQNEPVRDLKTEKQVLLGVGRLSRQKDFSTLLRAFARIHQRNTGMHLVILGEGEERPNLEALAKDLGINENVSLPGFVDNPFAYMSAADLFVLSSRSEGCPNVLIEAMACGTPVVSTDCPTGPDEILEGGKWGPLVPVGDDEALANAIMSTLEDPPVRSDQLVDRARDFASEKIAQQYLDVVFSD
jgi:glycosyltransferase involved in cell wall biosynthesis